MRIDLTTLKLFRAVAEEENIARAAEREHIAPSAISKRILDLEVDLKTQLLRRRQKGVELTAAGENLLVHSKSVFALIDRMLADMSGFAEGSKGVVRVAANTSAIIQYLPRYLAEFYQMFPGINVALQEEVSPRTIRLLQDGIVDLGIVTGTVEVEGVEFLAFESDRLVLVVPAEHALASRAAVGIEESLEYRHVGLEEGSAIQAIVESSASLAHRSIDMKVRVSSFDAVRSLVSAGLGVSVLPEACVLPFEAKMRLRSVALTDSWATRRMYLCHRSAEALSVTAKLLLDHLIRFKWDGVEADQAAVSAHGDPY